MSPYESLPVRGHLAVYTLNLVLLRAYLGDQNYLLDEPATADQRDACRPWDGLAYLWRSWFTVDGLSAVANRVTATRRDQLIEIAPQDLGLVLPARTPLIDFFRSAAALADDVATAGTIRRLNARSHRAGQ